MKRQFSFLLLPLFVTLSLLAAFVLTTPAFAQDEIPQTGPVPEEAPVAETPAQDGTPSEETPVEVPPESSQPPAAGVVSDLAPVLEAVADAGLVLVDGSGEPLTLASEETAQTLAGTDPYFKVGTVTYNFTLLDCYPAIPGDQSCPNPLQAAVDYIAIYSTIPSDGFIHLDADTTLPNQKVEIDGNDVNLAKLKGIMGHVDPDTLTPDVLLTYTGVIGDSGSFIHVFDKLNGFTLSGLNIAGNTYNSDYIGIVEFDECSGSILLQDLVVNDTLTRGAGIVVLNHNGSVTLTNVDSSHNAGGGAYIDNSAGTAGVTITNSSFDDNDGYAIGSYQSNGLRINTRGAVSMTAVTLSRNVGTLPGLRISQASSVTIKNSVFDNNSASYGLEAYGLTGTGAITLQNVYVDQNKYGYKPRTPGNITLTNVSASRNTGWCQGWIPVTKQGAAFAHTWAPAR